MTQHHRVTDVDYSPTYWPSVWPPLRLALGRFVIAVVGTASIVLLAWLTMRAMRGDR